MNVQTSVQHTVQPNITFTSTLGSKYKLKWMAAKGGLSAVLPMLVLLNFVCGGGSARFCFTLILIFTILFVYDLWLKCFNYF